MFKRKFEAVAQLHENNNADLIEYFEDSRTFYSQLVRKTFYAIKNNKNLDKSHYNSDLQSEYGILTRTANSIIFDAQGRLNALKATKEWEKQQAERKIKALEDKILTLNPKKIGNWKVRRQLVAKKAKLNKLHQLIKNLDYQIETGRYKLTFGTKKLLQTNYSAFIDHRDEQMSFIGNKNEKSGNQLLQLTYKNGQFDIRLRKDFGGYKNSDDKYIYGRVHFNYGKKIIKAILKNGNSPLSFQIIKKNNRYYLYCSFEIQAELEQFQTNSENGTIGLDFNKGFVTLAETNKYGHLVQTQFLPYRFKAGNKTRNDLERIANHVKVIAVKTRKNICIENLNFNATKAKIESKINKKYNEMLSSLAYREFVNTIERVTYKSLVYVTMVNPAWTSWLAKQLYCEPMKLNGHVGAAYVIARNGQGFKDSVKNN